MAASEGSSAAILEWNGAFKIEAELLLTAVNPPEPNLSGTLHFNCARVLVAMTVFKA